MNMSIQQIKRMAALGLAILALGGVSAVAAPAANAASDTHISAASHSSPVTPDFGGKDGNESHG